MWNENDERFLQLALKMWLDFKKFRNHSLKTYDLCHYLSAPALSCDGMLSMTKVISDADVNLLSYKSMGARASHISRWYSKANNMDLKLYDSKQESKHIIYLDVNDVYTYAMSKFLPTGRF